MPLRIHYQKKILDFRSPAGTSRGVLTQHTVFWLMVFDDEAPSIVGIGEASPLPGLSRDFDDFEFHLKKFCNYFNRYDLEVFPFNLKIVVEQLVEARFPALRFGLETALRDYLNGGKKIIFENDFSSGERSIHINGLVWMASQERMLTQIEEKLAAGFDTIKMKVGAIAFSEELACLEAVRSRFSSEEVTLRVDANGAFSPDEALDKLHQLARYQVHSIEQPIAKGQHEALQRLCEESPVPIALDEELIGIDDYLEKLRLLKKIRPAYIILKPTLLGDFQACREWIEVANRLGVKWWLTSALESNIGLNAIAQFAGEFQNPLPQGLGTGGLYEWNVESPLVVENGFLHYRHEQAWEAFELPQKQISENA